MYFNIEIITKRNRPLFSLKPTQPLNLNNLYEPTRLNQWCKLLIEEELFYKNQEGLDIRLERTRAQSLLRIRPSQVLNLLQTGQLLGVLRWKNAPLIIDFFTPLSLAINERDATFSCGWKVDSSLTFIPGPPHFVIKQNFMRTIHDAIPWELIECLQKDSFDLQSIEKVVQEQCQDAVTIIKNSIQKPLSPPKPILCLTDSTFAFANLWMESDSKRTLGTGVTSDEIYWEKDILECGFQKKRVGNSNYFCPLDKALDTINLLLDIGWTIETSDGKTIINATDIQINSHDTENSIDLTGTIQFGSKSASLNQVLHSFKKGQKLVDLGGNSTGLLATPKFQALQNITQEITLNATSASIPRIKQGLLSEIVPTAVKQATLQHSHFLGTLRHYQEEGVNWLLNLHKQGRSGLLADEMGLGKTVQILAFISHLKGRTLIVVPTTLIPNWIAESHRFIPNRPVVRYEGKERQELLKVIPEDALIITSYTLARLDVEILKRHTFSLIVLDEAQMIKNSSTQTSQALKSIPSAMRISLTGTPIENSTADLFSQYAFLEPELIDENTPVPLLKKLIKPYFLRRKKAEVLTELPPLQEQTVLLEMSEKQREIYDSFFQSFQKGLVQKVAVDGLSKWRMQVLEAILRLRQICCSPRLIPTFQEEDNSSAKIDQAISDIDTLLQTGKKVVLFSQFASLLHIIKKQISAPYVLLEGASKNRDQLIDSFTDPCGPNLLLATLKTGGVGLNLQAADSIILFDPWWNGAVEAQAISRAHRMGRKNTVFVTRYIMQNSIEEQIQQIRLKKESLHKAIFEEEDELPESMTEELLRQFMFS